MVGEGASRAASGAALAAALLIGGLLVSSSPARAATAGVGINDNFFSPSTVMISVGDTVQWTWGGANMHSTTSNTGIWDSGVQASGTFSQTFGSAGMFAYHCTIHGALG